MPHSTSTTLLNNSSDWHFHSVQFGEMSMEVDDDEKCENRELEKRGSLIAVSNEWGIKMINAFSMKPYLNFHHVKYVPATEMVFWLTESDPLWCSEYCLSGSVQTVPIIGAYWHVLAALHFV